MMRIAIITELQNNALQLTRGASEASGLRRTRHSLVPLAAERECSTERITDRMHPRALIIRGLRSASWLHHKTSQHHPSLARPLGHSAARVALARPKPLNRFHG